MGDQISFRLGDTSPTSHYRLLAEMAKLSRAELRTLKQRLVLALSAVRDDRFERPYRFAVPRTDCGFVIVPMQRAHHSKWRNALQNFTLASKHDFRVAKHVGIAIRKAGPHIDIIWAYVDQPWAPNPELDGLLKESNPFRRLLQEYQPRYHFDSDALRAEIGDIHSDFEAQRPNEEL